MYGWHTYSVLFSFENETQYVNKFDELMSNRVIMAKVIVQVLYYLKMFEINGEILPNVIMAADKNECFVIHANDFLDFFQYYQLFLLVVLL